MSIDINKFIRIEEVKHSLSRREIAKRLNTSPQGLSAKITRGTLKVCDLEAIANAMDCDLKIEFVDNK